MNESYALQAQHEPWWETKQSQNPSPFRAPHVMNSVELVAISETIVKGNKIRLTDPKKVYITKGLFSLYTWLIHWRRQTRMTLCLQCNYSLYFLRIYLLTHIHFRDLAEAYMNVGRLRMTAIRIPLKLSSPGVSVRSNGLDSIDLRAKGLNTSSRATDLACIRSYLRTYCSSRRDGPTGPRNSASWISNWHTYRIQEEEPTGTQDLVFSQEAIFKK